MQLVSTAAVLGLVMATLSSAFSYKASAECLSAKSTIEQFDTEQVTKLAMEKVCSQGCKPKWSDFRSGHREKYAIPIVNAESEKMGTPDLTPHYISLMDATYDMAEQKCGAKELGDKDLCQNTEEVKKIANCVRGNVWSLAVSKSSDILPIMLAAPCKKHEDYLKNPGLLEQTLPAYMEDYASQCEEQAAQPVQA
ncbi:hypothetical protein BDV23DRAFT_184860 [Aspergillus alliaceus]|uniref:Uncharacterized protein n=1 Tax=Petromyces alliaceus TaxID=209559 RepID=A0A5N7C4M4_PETAA|nr:hypothetical protein BDV23DRAFT_184860 [Aspergillus alliaceus]